MLRDEAKSLVLRGLKKNNEAIIFRNPKIYFFYLLRKEINKYFLEEFSC